MGAEAFLGAAFFGEALGAGSGSGSGAGASTFFAGAFSAAAFLGAVFLGAVFLGAVFLGDAAFLVAVFLAAAGFLDAICKKESTKHHDNRETVFEKYKQLNLVLPQCVIRQFTGGTCAG